MKMMKRDEERFCEVVNRRHEEANYRLAGEKKMIFKTYGM